jgi:hypothetical protein
MLRIPHGDIHRILMEEGRGSDDESPLLRTGGELPQDDELSEGEGALTAAELSPSEEVPERCRIAAPPRAIATALTRATIILSRVVIVASLHSIMGSVREWSRNSRLPEFVGARLQGLKNRLESGS